MKTQTDHLSLVNKSHISLSRGLLILSLSCKSCGASRFTLSEQWQLQPTRLNSKVYLFHRQQSG